VSSAFASGLGVPFDAHTTHMSKKQYTVYGTRRDRVENVLLYTGETELDLTDENNFSKDIPQSYSHLQQLEDGFVKEVEELPISKTWWQRR